MPRPFGRRWKLWPRRQAHQRRRRAIDWAFLVLVPVTLLGVALTLKVREPFLIESLRLGVFDVYQRIAPRPYEPAPVRIVDIDDESLSRIGQWPWPRDDLAEMVDRLTAMGAAAIAFDMVFAEPDRTSPARLLSELEQETGLVLDPALRAGVPDHDLVLSRSISQARVVLGHVLTTASNAARPAQVWGMAQAGDDPRAFLPSFEGAVTNLPELEEAAAGNGSINVVTDRDGLVRRVPLMMRVGEMLVPSLAAEALRVAQGASTHVVKSSGASGAASFGESTGVNALRIGGLEVQTDPSAGVWLYSTGPRPERFIPAWTILDGSADPAAVAGHIVLIGTSAAGLKDLRATALDRAGPGVEIHAQLIEQLLLGVRLNRPDWANGAELTYILVIGLALIVLLPRLGPVPCALIGGATASAALGASWFAFREEGLLFDPVIPALTVLAVYLVATLIGYARTEAERSHVRRAFGHYLSPELVDELAGDPDRLHIGGETRDLTVMFCDIRGFTAFSETRTPEQVTSIINRFLTPMTAEIMAMRGTIDKYIGDSIMAFWNAPLTDENHAEHACAAALAMRKALVALNRELEAEALAAGDPAEPLRFGVGINTGECLVGNMGSNQRFAYSAMGDAVNLASRLEGMTKVYGVDMVISEPTRTAAATMAAVELDLVQVVGRAAPVAIHALVGDASLAAEQRFQLFEHGHRAMLAAYRAGRFAEARDLMPAEAVYEAFGMGSVHALFVRRIGDREDVADNEWTGVYVAADK